jgi:hypothetical protein
MPLFLNNEEVEQLLTMKTCMDALETLYRELGEGTAVAASRTDIHSPTAAADGREAPMAHYLKSMSGASPHFGTAALRFLRTSSPGAKRAMACAAKNYRLCRVTAGWVSYCSSAWRTASFWR